MGGAYDTREISLNAGGPVGGRQLEHGLQRHARRRAGARQRVRRAARFGQSSTPSSAPPPACSSPGVIRKPSAQVFPTTAAATNSRKSATPKSARRRRRVRRGPHASRRRRHVRPDAGLFRSRRSHRFARRRAGHPRSVRRAAERRRHEPRRVFTATFTGTQKFSDLLSLAYGVDWLREEGTSDGSLDFGGGFVLPTSFELTRTSWAPFAEVRLDIELRAVDAGRRARRQAR